MNTRIAALISAITMAGFCLPSAGATEVLLPKQGTDAAFMLPINGYVRAEAGAPAEPSPLYKVWPPLPETEQTAGGQNVVATSPQAVPVLPSEVITDVQPIVIDNDEAGAVVEDNYQWQEIPDEEGKTQIKAGARFPVQVLSALSSKTAKVGDPVQARLKVDVKIGGKLIASKGSRVVGHVSSVMKARRIMASYLTVKRFWRANGMIGIQFDEIITDSGEHIPLQATPARQSRIVKNKAEGRVLGVNHNGEVVTPLSIQLKHQALHLAIRGAASAGGVFSFGIVPVAYGMVGAMNPDFAFLHPVGKNVPHRRLKGFAMGFISGVPGGFLIADTIIKGSEAVIKPGDEFLAEFKQDFTGEASTAAELVPGASTKVRGEVLSGGKSGDAKNKK
jgi:hypothetical protein